MPKAVIPLTATQIANAKPKDKKYKLSDGGGLSLCVYPTGKKAWILRVRDNGKDKELYKPLEDCSLADARLWRETTKQQIRKGTFDGGKNGATFRKVFDEWVERWQETVTETYAQQVIRSINKNIMPSLGDMLVSKIRPYDIVEALKPMEERGALEYLNRTKTGIKLPLDYAVSRGLIDINPALAVTRGAFKKHKPTNYEALPPDQLPKLIEAIEKGRDTQDIMPLTYYLIYWQLLTMTRPAEAVKSKWAEIDLNQRVWIIPRDKMKMRRDHVIPLSNSLINILNSVKKLNLEGNYLFEALGNRKGENTQYMSRETVNRALKRLNVNSSAHGLRSLARSYLGETGKFRREALELCLAHNVGSRTEQAYDRALYLDERREIIDYWSNEIERLRQQYKGF